MRSSIFVFLFLFFKTCLGQSGKYLDEIFEKVNKEAAEFNARAAEIAWNSSINPYDPELQIKSAKYQKRRIKWQYQTCNQLGTLFNRQLLNDTRKRQSYLLCRGSKFTFDEARLVSNIYEELQTIYSTANVCIPNVETTTITDLTSVEDAILDYLSDVKQFLNLKLTVGSFDGEIVPTIKSNEKNGFCLKGENDIQTMMAYSRREEVLRWLWIIWREKVGPPMKEPYRKLVDVENQATMRNGYINLGASWRDELEIPNLRKRCRHLYYSIKHLYTLLHGVVRFYLRSFYGDIVPERGPIPAHLFGDLWSQNWEPLADLIIPRNINIDKRIKQLNWTVEHMVKRAEDFYQSLGLPAMTETFWQKSVFGRENNTTTRCHGSAADMFQDGDYRLLYCSGTSKDDFYVLHHELGHIQYYMAYAHQPTLFRQANTALHESIGDAIMYGVLTPQHLNRLGIISDSLLYANNINTDATNIEPETTEATRTNIEGNDETLNEDNDIQIITNYISENGKYKVEKNKEKYDKVRIKRNVPKLFKPEELTTDMILMFKQALNKIPQIPFGLVIDEYRWSYFEDDIKKDEINKRYWELVEALQGIAPLKKRGEEYFDIGAKYHVPDNTPYIRYFLSSFLQHQIFEKLCIAAVFGQRNTQKALPESITLNRCDIYGSKAAGKILKDIMSRGHSQHWSKILQATINVTNISSSAFMRYYRPLQHILERFVHTYNIPLGW